MEDPSVEARRESAKQAVRHCDDRLAKYRAALDAGVDPIVVGQWITEVQGQRLRAELALQQTKPGDRMTKDQIKAVVAQLGDVMGVLKRADPADKAEVYAQLGLRLIYKPDSRTVTAEARPTDPCRKACVRGPKSSVHTASVWRLRSWSVWEDPDDATN